MKKIIPNCLLLLLMFSAITARAEDLGYEAVSPPQPTADPKKIEVIEFFWYGCPHCYSFEPSLAAWLKNKPDNVVFVRQPAAFSELWAKHAKAYFVAEALGIVDKVHADFFDAIQNKNQKLDSEDRLAKFFVDHGVKEAEFRAAYNSFLVDAKMRQAAAMPARYGITGVPAMVVNGKYKTNGTLAGSQEGMIDVVNRLIKQESSK